MSDPEPCGDVVFIAEMCERNGPVVASFPATKGDQLMLVTDQAKLIRMPLDSLRVLGRAWNRCAKSHLPPQNDQWPMDGHDVFNRAPLRNRPRFDAHQSRTPSGRHVSIDRQ